MTSDSPYRSCAFEALVLTLAVSTVVGAQGASTNAPTAARELARGITLSSADIAGDSLAVRELVGMVTRRVVRPGEALRAPTVGPAPMVTSGSAVTVRTTVGEVVASRDGTALGGGVIGERIRVRLDAQRTITGVIAGRNLVTAP